MKSNPPRKTIKVKQLSQLSALAHPLRYQIFERLVIQPGSPKAVALDMGLKETRLYHHFRVLENAKLIQRTRSQRRRGAIEHIYSVVSDRIVLDKTRFAGDFQPGGSVAVQVLQATIREVERCEAHAHTENREPELDAVRLILRLSPARAAELEARLAELVAEAKQEDAGEPQSEYHVTLVAHRAAPRPSMGDSDESE